TGIFGSAAFLYSQEVGIACGVAVAFALVLQPKQRTMSLFWTGLGAALLLVPALIYVVSTHSLNAMIENLFLFPRVRLLGFAGKPVHTRIGAVVSLFLCCVSLIPWIPIARETIASLIEPSSGRMLDLPRGGSALLPEEFAFDLEETVHAIQSRTSPNESFWV